MDGEYLSISVYHPIMSGNPSVLRTQKSSGALIADAIRAQIMRGDRPTGEPLRQEALAAEFEVSKIPIREALVKLESEGLVTVSANRGATITPLSVDELEEIFLMRLALEPAALRSAVPLMGRTDLRAAEGLLDDIAATRDPATWSELNWDFHAALYRPSNMRHLLRTLESLYARTAKYVAAYRARALPESADAEHRSILRACREENTSEACARLTAHLGAARAALHELFPADQRLTP